MDFLWTVIEKQGSFQHLYCFLQRWYII